jgi:hypothetical protein
MERPELEQWIESGKQVTVNLIPSAGKTWTEQGVITKIFSDDWFRIESKKRSAEWHLDQVDTIIMD